MFCFAFEIRTTIKMQKKRKYDESYIKWGFTKHVNKDRTEYPLCVLCKGVLAQGSVKPSALKAHLENVHPGHIDDTMEQFKIREEQFRLNGTLTTHGFQRMEKVNLQASYAAALILAKMKKPHTDRQNVVKPSALKIARILFGQEVAKKNADDICLSDDTIKRRIQNTCHYQTQRKWR